MQGRVSMVLRIHILTSLQQDSFFAICQGIVENQAFPQFWESNL